MDPEPNDGGAGEDEASSMSGSRINWSDSTFDLGRLRQSLPRLNQLLRKGVRPTESLRARNKGGRRRAAPKS